MDDKTDENKKVHQTMDQVDKMTEAKELRFQQAIRNAPAYDKLYPFEREALLKDLETGVAQRSDRDAAQIKIEEMPENQLGQYSYDDHAVELSAQMVRSDGHETIQTLLHEGRHGKQEEEIDRYIAEGNHPNHEIVDGWLDYGKEDMSYDEYMALPAEKDAFAYEEAAMEELESMRDYINDFDSEHHASNQILEAHDQNALEGYTSEFDFAAIDQDYNHNTDVNEASGQIESQDIAEDISEDFSESISYDDALSI